MILTDNYFRRHNNVVITFQLVFGFRIFNERLEKHMR